MPDSKFKSGDLIYRHPKGDYFLITSETCVCDIGHHMSVSDYYARGIRYGSAFLNKKPHYHFYDLHYGFHDIEDQCWIELHYKKI